MHFTNRTITHLAVILALWVASLAFYGAIPYQDEPFQHWDLEKYLEMAKAAPELDGDVKRPYVHRPLGPWLAGSLSVISGLPLDSSFRVLGAIAAALCLMSLYGFWRHCGLAGIISLSLVLIFLANRTQYGFLVWDYFQLNDWIGLMTFVGGLWALYRSHWSCFSATLFVGILAREGTLIVIPVAVVFLYERGRLQTDWTKLVLAAIPAILAFSLVRVVLQGEGSFRVWKAPLWFYTKPLRLQAWFGWLLNAFAPVTWLPLIFWPETRDFMSKHKHMLLLVVLLYASTLLAYDTERLLAPAGLAVYWLVGRIAESRGRPAALRLVGMLLLLAAVTSIRHHLPRAGLADAPLIDLGFVVLPALLALGYGKIWRDRWRSPG